MNGSTQPQTEQRVYIIDDDLSICKAMMNLLSSAKISALLFSSAEEFREFWREDCAGCLLLDVRLPGITGVEFQDQLRAANIDIPIIFMTAHGDIPMVRRVMKAGAVEFLTKPFHKDELMRAVAEAFEIDAARRKQMAELQHLQALYGQLVPREKEVMDLVVAGLPNKQIADKLALSEITIKFHRRHVMEKMKAGSLAELVCQAQIIKSKFYTKG